MSTILQKMSSLRYVGEIHLDLQFGSQLFGSVRGILLNRNRISVDKNKKTGTSIILFCRNYHRLRLRCDLRGCFSKATTYLTYLFMV